MKKLLLLILMIGSAFFVKGQQKYTIASDTVSFLNTAGDNTSKPVLQIKNKWKDSVGYILTNIGNGNYIAQAPKRYLDSLRRSGLSVFGYKEGVATLQYIDSIGVSGGSVDGNNYTLGNTFSSGGILTTLRNGLSNLTTDFRTNFFQSSMYAVRDSIFRRGYTGGVVNDTYIAKVDGIDSAYMVNDSIFRFTKKGVTYNLLIRGNTVGGSADGKVLSGSYSPVTKNLTLVNSVSPNVVINIKDSSSFLRNAVASGRILFKQLNDSTSEFPRLSNGYGTFIDSAAGQVIVRADTSSANGLATQYDLTQIPGGGAADGKVLSGSYSPVTKNITLVNSVAPNVTINIKDSSSYLQNASVAGRTLLKAINDSTGEFTRLLNGYGIFIDSTSGQLAFRVDTASANGLATQYDLSQIPGGGSPSLTNQRIGFGSGGILKSTGDASFAVDTVTKKVIFIGNSVGDNNSILELGANNEYSGTKPFLTFKAPRTYSFGAFSHDDFKFQFHPSSNGDGTFNNVLKLGFNIDGATAGKSALFFALEPDWLSGGLRYREAHLQYHHTDGTAVRLFSSTLQQRSTLALTTNQWDFRGNTFILSDLGNAGNGNSYFSVSKPDNTVGTAPIMLLYGDDAIFRIQNNANTAYKTDFTQNGQDLFVNATRNVTINSAGSFNFNTNMQFNPASIDIAASVNWGNVLKINTTNASNSLFTFQRNGTPFFWSNINDKVFLKLSSVDSTGAVGGYYLYVDSITDQIKRSLTPLGSGGGGGSFTGSGTSGRGVKFTGATALANSLIYDNAAGIGINANPASGYTLDNQQGHFRSDFYESATKYGSLYTDVIGANEIATTLENEPGAGVSLFTLRFRDGGNDRWKTQLNTGTGAIREILNATYYKTVEISTSEIHRTNSTGLGIFKTPTKPLDVFGEALFTANGGGQDFKVDAYNNVIFDQNTTFSSASNIRISSATTKQFELYLSGAVRGFFGANTGTGEVSIGSSAGYFTNIYSNNAVAIGIGTNVTITPTLIAPDIHFVLNTALINMNGSSMQIATGNGVPKMIINSAGNTTIGDNITPNNRKLFVDGSIGANKDSITIKSTIVAQSILLEDTVTNKFERIKLSDFNTQLGNDEGDYTPTLTSVANVSGTPTASSWHFRKDGNTIVAFGEITIDPTTTLVLTQLAISFPAAWPSGVAGIDVSGYGVVKTLNETMAISGDNGNARAILEFTPIDVAARTIKCQMVFKYIPPAP